MSSGNNYALNTELVEMEYLKNMLLKVKIERMYFSIKQTMIIIFPELFWLIWNQEL